VSTFFMDIVIRSDTKEDDGVIYCQQQCGCVYKNSMSHSRVSMTVLTAVRDFAGV